MEGVGDKGMQEYNRSHTVTANRRTEGSASRVGMLRHMWLNNAGNDVEGMTVLVDYVNALCSLHCSA